MIAVGFGLAWIGYTLGYWGLSMVKGWDLSFSQIASPTSYYKGAWPPPTAPNTILIPNGKSGQDSSQGGTSLAGGKQSTSGSTAGGGVAPVNGKCPPGTILINGKCEQHVAIP
jgi:hypothetical protein